MDYSAALSTVVRYVKGFHPSVANEVINLSADPSQGGVGETKQRQYNWWIKRFVRRDINIYRYIDIYINGYIQHHTTNTSNF